MECNLALEEAQKASFSDDEAFLLPVVIDDTKIDDPAIPSRFRASQWKSLPGGQPTPDSLTRVELVDTKYAAPAIPSGFRASQWKSLPGGQPTPDFVSRVQQLYRKYL